MAYSAPKHAVFSDRMVAWFGSIQNLLEEGERLDQIYIQETSSGVDADFTDTDNAKEAEHVAGIVFFREYRAFIVGNAVATLDRRPSISPFIQ